MKTLIKSLTLTLTLITGAEALAYEVPKDAVIKVYDSSGKQIGSMSRAEYKVVKVEQPKAKSSPANITKAVPVKRNRVRYKAGVGYGRASVASSGSKTTVTERVHPVVGVGYDRKLEDDVVVGVDVLSNGSTTVNIGMDF